MPRKAMQRLGGGRYKPVNIRNPSGDGHVVVVHPRQCVRVGLNAKEYPSARVEAVSELLVPSMTGTETVGDKVTNWFEFEQLFDPASWVTGGCVHIGHIQIAGEGFNAIRLPVMLRGGGRTSEPGVTVINPREDQVRLRPDQVLHVVLHIRGDRDCREEFIPVVNQIEGAATWLKCIRSETVILDAGSPPSSPDHLFDPGVWLTDRLPRNPDAEMPGWLGHLLGQRAFRQHHFWFAVDPAAAEMAKGGSSSLVVWNLACGSPTYSLNVLLPVGGRKPPVDADDWNAMIAAAAQRGLYQKQIDLDGGYLVSPGEVEMVDLVPGRTDKRFLVEIPPPSRDGLSPLSPGLGWVITSEPVVTSDGDRGPSPRMALEELETRCVNGVTLKRLLVRSHLEGLPPDMDSFFLGTLHAKPAGVPLEHVGIKDRRLKIWLSKKLDRPAKSAAAIVSGGDFKPKKSHRSSRHQVGPVKTYRTVARITIEELKGERLEQGTRCVEYGDIQLGVCTATPKKKTSAGGGGSSPRSAAGGTSLAGPTLPALPMIGPPPWCLTVTNPSDRQACVFRFGGQVVFRMPLWDDSQDAWWKFRAELSKGQNLIRHRENLVEVEGKKWQQFWFRHRVSEEFPPGRWVVGRLMFEGQASGLEVNLAAELPLLPKPGAATRVSYLVSGLDTGVALIKVGDELELKAFKNLVTVDRGGTYSLPWVAVEWPWWLSVMTATTNSESPEQSFLFKAQDRLPTAGGNEGVVALRCGDVTKRVRVRIVE